MRFIRYVWPLIFFIPLGDFAGRYCWLSGIDPLYHSLLFTHEYMPQILLAYGLVSVALVVVSDARARERLDQLAGFAVPPPERMRTLLARESGALGLAVPSCAYLDVAQSFCFTANGATEIFISRGFIDSFGDDELALTLRHELVHIARRHPDKAFAWRIVTRFLMLPGFRSLERWRHARREEIADRETAGATVERYRALLVRAAVREHTPLLSWRLSALLGRRPTNISVWPAIVAGVVLVGLISSHFIFLDHAAYLMSHHC